MRDGQSAEFLRALTAAWEREPRIDQHHFPLHARLERGTLILEGRPRNIAAKKLGANIARSLAGDLAVVDRLRLAAPDEAQQGRLRDAVTRSLLEEPAFAEYGLRIKRDLVMETLREPRQQAGGQIDVAIDGGLVTLVGEVGSLSHRRLAEVLTWWAGGCEVVENHLRVVPPEEENDGELADAARIVLEKDPLVHADQLVVQARDGRVRLDGYVASEEEARLAVLDIWYIPGVREVENHIRTH
jgi:osmotically-inducible protein OsmY